VKPGGSRSPSLGRAGLVACCSLLAVSGVWSVGCRPRVEAWDNLCERADLAGVVAGPNDDVIRVVCDSCLDDFRELPREFVERECSSCEVAREMTCEPRNVCGDTGALLWTCINPNI
jgi:hypothetical protein